MLTSPKLLAIAIVTASLAACGGAATSESSSPQESTNKTASPAAEKGTKNLSFDVNVRAALSAGISASRATVKITKGGLERTQTIDVNGDTATVNFNSLPIGNYDIEVKVFDGDSVVAEGTGDATINADTQSEISLVLNPTTGNLQVNLCMPDSGIEYQSGSVSSVFTKTPSSTFRDILAAQPITTTLDSEFISGIELDVNFKVGHGEITPKDSSSLGLIDTNPATPILNIDHGASLSVVQSGAELLSVNGCDTEMYAYHKSDGIEIVYVIDTGFSVTLENGALGVIEADKLTVSVDFSKEGYEIPQGVTNLSEVDFSQFDQAKAYVGVPMPTGESSGISTLVAHFQAMKDLAIYLGSSEEEQPAWQ